MSRPDTKYVAVGDADVAYQVLGEGPSDLLFFNGLGSNVEMAWEDPDIADFLRRLATLRRLIFLDRRGTGASDGVPRNAIPTWEEWTEDIESVLNAVGSEQTSILATVDAGPIAILYAAAHPERVDSLVLCNTTARYVIADDYPMRDVLYDVDKQASDMHDTSQTTDVPLAQLPFDKLCPGRAALDELQKSFR